MARSLNKIMLIGSIGREAETRVSPEKNVSYTRFSVATEHGYKDKNGSWVNETTWHNVVAFSLNEYTAKQLVKGAKVYVEGRIQVSEYTDQNQNKRTKAEVIAEKVMSLDSRGGSQDGAQRDSNYSTGSGKNSQPEGFNTPPASDSGEEDLPF